MNNGKITKESFTNYTYFEADTAGNGKPTTTRLYRNFVTYLTIFQSDLYCINNLNCYYEERHLFKPNYTGNFSMNFTRTGYFTFESFRRKEEEYVSRIMLEKPGCEFRFIQPQPGEGSCTVISFTDEGYQALCDLYPTAKMPFFSDNDKFSTIITADATADLLHHRLLQRALSGNASQLEVDCLVAELTETVMRLLHQTKPAEELSDNLRRYHLRTLERAKEYLLHHFTTDVTLHELASHCYVSHFHFTRLFRQLCGYSPFHYLQKMRLTHAEMLMRTTGLPVTDVCFQSGFNRLDYFSGCFRRQYGHSPAKYRLAQPDTSAWTASSSSLLLL